MEKCNKVAQAKEKQRKKSVQILFAKIARRLLYKVL